MGGRGGGGFSTVTAATSSASVTSSSPGVQIQDTVRELARQNPSNDWVSIADVRDQLPAMSRATFDRTLVDLSIGEKPPLWTIPESNQKTLTKRQRDAAISIGGEPNHVTRLSGGL